MDQKAPDNMENSWQGRTQEQNCAKNRGVDKIPMPNPTKNGKETRPNLQLQKQNCCRKRRENLSTYLSTGGLS
jgi:hypothetical protein